MNKLLSEILKVNTGIAPASVAHGNIAVSRLFPLGDKQRKALFAVTISSANLNNAQRIDMGIVDDTVALPAVTTNLATRYAAGDTLAYEDINPPAATRCTAMSVDLAGVPADGAITINGTVFPYAAVPATALEWSNRATLITAINAAGLGLTAAAGAGVVVTIISTIAGDKTITFTETVTAIAATDIIITQMVAYMEVDASQLNAGATGVYGVVDYRAGAGAIVVSGALIRGHGRYTPEQAVAVPA